MKKITALSLAIILLLSLSSCSIITPSETDAGIGVSKHTKAYPWNRGKLETFPEYADFTALEAFQIDFRSYDISGLDLSNKYEALLYSDFDSDTKWPDILPDGFSPKAVMELGKDPGLGVRALHKIGIDGGGVSIAIIDQVLYTEHSEYADRLKHYEAIPATKQEWAMHGNAVASLAVGKTTGVAPKADLYFIASDLGTSNNITYIHYAKSIDRILEINKLLPDEQKIRAISISRGWDSADEGYDEVKEAIARAKDEGVFVVSTSLAADYGFYFAGLDKEPLGDPDDISSYSVGTWQKPYLNKQAINESTLFFPMDSRAYASWTGENNYAWGRQGGWSWVCPYIAGLYALCVQVYPDVTPDLFWEAALETADSITVDNLGVDYTINHIVNPTGLINHFAGLINDKVAQ